MILVRLILAAFVGLAAALVLAVAIALTFWWLCAVAVFSLFRKPRPAR